MKKSTNLWVFIVLTTLILSSCKKVETVQSTDQSLYQQAKGFLKQKQMASSPQVIQKIQSLSDQLLDQNVKRIETYKENEAIICDL